MITNILQKKPQLLLKRLVINTETMGTQEELDEEMLLCPEQPSTKDIMDMLFKINKDTSSTNKTLNSTNKTLNDYMKVTNTKFDDVKKELNKNSAQIKSLNDKIISCETLANSVNYSFEMQKQKMLRNNISIFGLPHNEGENLSEIVDSVCKAIQIEVMPTDMQACYRVKGKFKIVVVKFVSFETKDKIMKAKTDKTIKLSDIFENITAEQDAQIFINNHTTPYFGRLLFHGRKAIKENLIHACWVSSNGFYIKKTSDAAPKEVKYIDELLEMSNQSNDESSGNSGNNNRNGNINNSNNNNKAKNNKKRANPDEKDSPNNTVNHKSKLRARN